MPLPYDERNAAREGERRATGVRIGRRSAEEAARAGGGLPHCQAKPGNEHGVPRLPHEPGPVVAALLRRVVVRDRLWVVELVSDYGERIYTPVLIIELRDGKMWRDTRYYAEPFEAPEWRTQWVERVEN